MEGQPKPQPRHVVRHSLAHFGAVLSSFGKYVDGM